MKYFSSSTNTFMKAGLKISLPKKGRKTMRSTLSRMLTIAAFNLLVIVPVMAQDIQVKNNGGVRLQKISLLYRLSPTGAPQPAFGNYFVPRDVTSLIFRIELADKNVKTINYRLQIRQICSVKLSPDANITQEREFLATTTAMTGKPLTTTSRTFDLEIQVHPTPEGSVPHDKTKHCFGDDDHLGEGPHEASIALALDDSLRQGSDTLHVLYTADFRTIVPDMMDRMRGSQMVNPLERSAHPKHTRKRPSGGNR